MCRGNEAAVSGTAVGSRNGCIVPYRYGSVKVLDGELRNEDVAQKDLWYCSSSRLHEQCLCVLVVCPLLKCYEFLGRVLGIK